ncbi:MAG: ATP-binding protein [Thermoguttaceae bacterium]|jgi:signal transduction histidine kinase
MTFRRRILMAMTPLLALLVALGATGIVLILHLGRQIDDILRENYDSVVYMRDLNEALERIDSAFQFALAGRDEKARKQYDDNWVLYRKSLGNEQNNITVPGEAELVEKLTGLSEDYRRLGDEFFAKPGPERDQLYFDRGRRESLYGIFGQIKAVAGEILWINQRNMEEADQRARRLARSSLVWYGGGLACGVALALLLVAGTIVTIVRPVRAVTESAMAIGAGDLDQLVSVTSDDELGQLAGAFNSMARQLREFRQSHKAQLIRAQQTSQATIDSFPDPVLVLDPEQHVEMANPAARRLLGVRPREEGAIRPPAWEAPEGLRQPLGEVLRTQTPFLPDDFDKALVLRMGEDSRSYLPRILPIRDRSGATHGAAVLLEDVTRFRLLDEVKSNLVATVSHELKTPLTSIRLVLHLLLEESAGPLAPKQTELLVDARDNAERLLAMINNLLDLARLEQGRSQLELRPQRPALILQAAAEAFRPRSADRGIELAVLDCGDLEPVAVDPEQFQHALHNLLDNALAHTPQGGRITLAARRVNGQVVFSVTDTGSGIPAEYLPVVFEKYFRVPGDARGGTGLGLAIVREIVTAHGGTVHCESSPGRQTVFQITLPAGAADKP